MIDISFRTFLETLTTLPVVQDVVSEDISTARVWYQLANTETDLAPGGWVILYDTTFNVEIMSTDIDQVQTEANNIRTALNGYRGLMATDKILGCFVLESSDDYTPKNLDADEGIHLATFRARLLY